MRRPMPWKPQKMRRPSQDKGARWRGAFGKLKQAHAEDNTALSLCERALAGKVGGDALRRELRNTFKELSYFVGLGLRDDGQLERAEAVGDDVVSAMVLAIEICRGAVAELESSLMAEHMGTDAAGGGGDGPAGWTPGLVSWRWRRAHLGARPR